MLEIIDMENLTKLYKEQLKLNDASLIQIEHEDAMVATVYKVVHSNGSIQILKVCLRPDDYYREKFFLDLMQGKIPTPRILGLVPPTANLKGAILLEYCLGNLLSESEISDNLAFELGASLAQIHLNRTKGYGDLIKPESLSTDPFFFFTFKFLEGLDECVGHLPDPLIAKCRRYFDHHLQRFDSVDGPCVIHRDYRPGNIIADKGNLTGIIDWASARASFAEEDFCSLEHSEWPAYSKTSFLQGYESIRPVPNYAEMMPFLRLSKSIATIGFTVKTGIWNSTASKVYQRNRNYLDTLFPS